MIYHDYLSQSQRFKRDYIAQHVSDVDAVLCLKGTRICGYATILDAIAIHIDPQYEQYKQTYLSLIDQWLSNQYHH